MSAYERQVIDPWHWNKDLGFVQAVETVGGRTLHLAGMTATDTDGTVQHVGDVRGQVMASIDTMEDVLSRADMTLADVVRLNWYVRADVADAFWSEVAEDFRKRLMDAGCKAGGAALFVSALAWTDLLVEFDATAVAAERPRDAITV